MNESNLNRMIREHKARIIWFLVFLILAVFVTALVFGTLKRSVQAQTYTKRVFACSYAQEGAEPVAHQHNDDCYENGELICTLPERELHIHGDECYTEEKVLVCTLEEGEGHVHTDACYTEEPVLVCTLEESDGHVHSIEAGCYTRVQGDLICTDEDPEHVHTDECYAWEEVLTCEIPEGEGAHHHSEECYETQLVLSCGKEEGEGAHTHDDTCYEINKVLICDKEEVKTEHVHTVDCFQVTDMSPEEIHALHMSELPESDPDADVESPDVWESRFASVPLSGHWDRDLLKIAETQLGYTESQRNFEAVPDEYGDGYTLKGWTRYGAWYGIPYGDWCAMFISFCLNYADIPESAIPYDCATTTWIDSLSARGMYAPAGSYDPKPGDLIFFDWEGDGLSDHVGIVWAVNPGSITTIEGNHTISVELFDYDISDSHIQGYGILPENPALAVTSSDENLATEQEDAHSDDGESAAGTSEASVNSSINSNDSDPQVSEPPVNMPPFSYSERVAGMRVSIEADAGAFPEGTTVTIKPIEDDGLAEQVAPAISGQIVKVQAVDITFYDADGNEIEPRIPIRVTMRPFTETEADNVGVVHVDSDGVVSAVDTQNDVTQPDQGVAFSADSFSTYALVYTVTFACDADGNVYQYSMPGGTGLSLRELLIDLGMKTESNVDSYLSHVVNVAFSKPDCMTLTKEGNDWRLQSVHAFDTPESLTVTFDDYSMLAIPVTVSGIEELQLENASISSADGVFLPEGTEGYADVVEDTAETISAVEDYVEKNTPEPTLLQQLFSFGSKADENKDGSDKAYQVFDIGLDNIDTDSFKDGFNVEVKLPENVIGRDFHLYHIHDNNVEEIDLTLASTKVETGSDLVTGFSFQTDSFSTFTLSYTVDFHYHGAVYSIPGNTQILLTQLIEIMHITMPDNAETPDNAGNLDNAENLDNAKDPENAENLDSDKTSENDENLDSNKASENEALLDVHDVASVEFTDTHLVQVDQVSGLLTINGADGKLTDVDAGDYNFLLSSLEPFSTEEKLTITLKDGTVIEVGVTDAQSISSAVITFYAIDGTTIDTGADVSDYKAFIGNSNNLQTPVDINPVNGVATLNYASPIDMGNNMGDWGKDWLYFGPANSKYTYEQNVKGLGEVFSLGSYEIDSKYTIDKGVLYIKAVKQPAYEVEIVTADGNGASGIGNSYSIYAGVDKPNQNGQSVRYYSKQSVDMEGQSSQPLSFSTFNRSNDIPTSQGFTSGDDVQIVLVSNLQVEQNGNDRGTISSGTIIGDGDLLGDYTVSITTTDYKTTYTLTKNNPYKINIKTSADGNVEFDNGYSGYWYLLSTLTKSNGSKYYYVQQVASNSNTINKVINQEIVNFYNVDQLSNVSISSPSGNTSVYQSGDTVENKLVYTGNNQKSNYDDILKAEAYGNGDFLNKYAISDETTSGVGSVILTPIPDFKVKTVFKEADDSDTPAGDVPNDYKLLIKMVRDRKTYYALHEVSETNSSAESAPIMFYEYIPGQNGGNASVGSMPYYYSGTETLITQVVTGAATILDALNNDAENVIHYNENTVGAENQNSDLTKDLFSTSSQVVGSVMTTTFTRQKNVGVEHDIKVSFYKEHTGSIGTAELDDTVALDGTYFFCVKLFNSGKLVGYTIVRAEEASSQINNGSFTTTISADHNFTLVDDKGVNIEGSTLHYDPSVYTSEVRLYKTTQGTSLPASLQDVANKGDDKVPGYDFWQNVYSEDKTGETINKTWTDLALYKEHKKIYQVKVVVEDGTELNAADNIRLNVLADHATTVDQRLSDFDITSVTSTVEDGRRIYTIVIEDQVNNTKIWTSGNNSINGNETFTVEVTQNGKKRYEGYPIKLSGSSDNFAVNYDTQIDRESGKNIQVDDGKKVTTITNWVYINKVNYDGAIHPDYILGDAVEFGIVANKYKQRGHTETNFAVNVFEGNDCNTDIDGSGEGDIPIYVGSIVNQLWLSSASLAPIDVYIPVEYDDHNPATNNGIENRRLRITTTLPTTIIHMSQEEIRRYVDSMIEYGQRMSLNLADLSTVRPYQIDNNDKTLDFTDFPDNTTIYVDCSDITSMIGNSGWYIHKRENQSIVFNVPGEDVRIGEFYVSTYDGNGTCTVQDLQSTTSALNGNVTRNRQVDDVILQHITFNCYQAEKLDTFNASAVFLAPFADYVTQENGAGWILAEGTVDSKAEWHYYYHYRHYSSSSKGDIILLTKALEDENDNTIDFVNMDFKFTMTETNSNWEPLTGQGSRKTTWTTEDGEVKFTGFKYNNHDIDPSGDSAGKTKSFYYVIEEVPAEGAKTDGDGKPFYIDGIEYSKEKVKIRVDAYDEGNGTINCTYYAVNDQGVSQVNLNSVNNTFSFGTIVNKIAVGQATVLGKKSFVPVGSHTVTQDDVNTYEFTLEAVTPNAPMPEVSTKKMNSVSDPIFSFDDITFSSANLNRDAKGKPIETVFKYRITESGEREGIVNDTRVHTVEITVSPVTADHLKLNTVVKYFIDGVEVTEAPFGAVFTNTNEGPTRFSFTKAWYGIDGGLANNWPENIENISISLYNSKGDKIDDFDLSKTGGTNGTYTWTATKNTDGTYTFTVTDLPAKDGDTVLSYYVTERKVPGYNEPSYGLRPTHSQSGETVETIATKPGVNDNDRRAYDGEYVINRQEGGYELPQTGGPGTALYGLLGGLMVVTAGAVLTLRRKKKNKA